MRRIVLRGLLAAAVLYLLLGIALFSAMLQPPERFGKIVSKIPGPFVFGILPFRQLWYVARGGRLKAGDVAPDFELATLDKTSQARLSSFRGRKPVVLIFGSYT